MTERNPDPWEFVSEPHTEGVVYRAPGEGEIPSIGFEGDRINILVDGTHTRGLGAFLEYTVAPQGKGPGLHWHRGYDELFYVVRGTLGVIAAGESREMGEREFVFVPRGVVHNFWNPTDEECIFVSGWAPPGSEQFFAQSYAAVQAGASMEEVGKIAQTMMEAVMVEGPHAP